MSFILKEIGFAADQIVSNGNKFLTGNGYIGYRGTLDEFSAKECVGVNIAGEYDGVPGKWRETLNVFNPLFLMVQCGKVALDVRGENLLSHTVTLDISTGVFSRKTVFRVDGGEIELYGERFVSQSDKNLICSRTVIQSSFDTDIVIRTGVDPDVWELNGPHFKDVTATAEGNVISVEAVTQEKGVPVRVSCKYSAAFQNFERGFAEIAVKLEKKRKYVLERIATVSCGDRANVPCGGYTQHFTENLSAWKNLWKVADVKIEGDEKAQFALRYSIYHLLILAPKGSYSIAARGLSGQTYKGAVFWDTEIFMLPFFLTNFPQTAKNLVRYRIDTLREAKKKAAQYGYQGAFYAWESQDGYDACSDFNVVDVFTHRPVRTYFKDKQIHISADVAYAVCEYYRRTEDDGLMLDGGLETLLECAAFYYSYSYYNPMKGRYELLDVIGPDEYHERVNNNAYTNYMAHYAAEQAVAFSRELGKKYPLAVKKILDGFDGDWLEKLQDWADRLYLPQPDRDGIIEQFDGYFKLEDTDVATVRSRLVNPNEYWGGSGGVATATRVIKQADVIMLFNLLPDLFDTQIQKANYDFYLKYTEHGSSLSHCAYALTACRTGENGGSWDEFLHSAEIDLKGGGKQWAGEIYIGGTHPAASGGAWMTAIYGFAGLRYGNGKAMLSPVLPQNIQSIEFTAVENGRPYKITVKGKEMEKELLT